MNAETIAWAVLGGAIVAVIGLVVGAAMAGRANADGAGPHRKPRADVYTMMLFLSLAAILAACLCLYFELEMYEWKHKDPGAERGLNAAIETSATTIRHWFT